MWQFDNEEYRKKAVLEDILIGMVYRLSLKFTFHGGTCIWRCHNGNRFSRDIDLYYDLGNDDRSDFTKRVVKLLRDNGISVKEQGYNRDTDTLSIIVETNTKCKLDINFKYREGKAIDYAMVDGSLIKVIGLSADELIDEKIGVLLQKTAANRSEIQDLYDIWILKDKAKMSAGVRKRLLEVVTASRERPPANAGSLNALILSGVAPALEQILDDIRRVADAHKKD